MDPGAESTVTHLSKREKCQRIRESTNKISAPTRWHRRSRSLDHSYLPSCGTSQARSVFHVACELQHGITNRGSLDSKGRYGSFEVNNMPVDKNNFSNQHDEGLTDWLPRGQISALHLMYGTNQARSEPTRSFALVSCISVTWIPVAPVRIKPQCFLSRTQPQSPMPTT